MEMDLIGVYCFWGIVWGAKSVETGAHLVSDNILVSYNIIAHKHYERNKIFILLRSLFI